MLGISKKEAIWYLFVGITTLINGLGSGKSTLYFGFAAERDQCQRADGGVGESTAEVEV